MGNYENSAGLGVRNHYGPKIIDEGQKFGGEVSTSMNVKEKEWTFTYDDLPSAQNLSMEQFIPAGAQIISARLQVVEAFAGGTSYDIGTEENDGTAIDANGLFAGTLLAEIDAVNEWVVGAGAQIDGTIGTPFDAYLLVVATGTFTAGKARVIVEYREADVDATGNYVAGGVKGDGT